MSQPLEDIIYVFVITSFALVILFIIACYVYGQSQYNRGKLDGIAESNKRIQSTTLL